MQVVDGWLSTAEKVVSPHFNERPDGCSIRLLVIHNISLPPYQFDVDWVEPFFVGQLDTRAHPYFYQLEGLRVSSHLYIKRNGKIIQFVPFEKRAWHAGQSEFMGDADCNDFSIGIEMAGADSLPYTKLQYEALIDVTRVLQKNYPLIKKEHIVGHCDIAPQRKTDPGISFNWSRYLDAL
ncbi:1,6-anhydro-N-acetylmuramyl-L-alanine amidase AmpD [Aliikangiella sp. G2MR2-5]|uniref:1,6-anhydro-N-acetylmuramyl-L-alanine amidase AmpD n=1 Tax=Aliikangiella sp. G2MR2-5 TaxID=2788943 RepID=UPI0018A8E9C5|nr:1,6-anhydro-N-acetylmuramyl-L-alanine amidase AmpD [Aliikangiella sp. G2MR2-5]